MRRNVVTEVAFDGTVSQVLNNWTDVSGDVSSIDINRGRNAELDSIEAGTATIVLDDSDGRYTPGRGNGSSSASSSESAKTSVTEQFSSSSNVTGGGTTAATIDFPVTGRWYVSGPTGAQLWPTDVDKAPDHVALFWTASVSAGGVLEAGVAKASTLKTPVVVNSFTSGDTTVANASTVTVTGRLWWQNETNAGSAGTVRVGVAFDDASGTTLSTVWGSSASSALTWQIVTVTATAPAGAVYARPIVQGTNSAVVGNIDFYADYVTVDVTQTTTTTVTTVVSNGYGAKIKPRRPVRVYTVLDDNLVRFDCVKPQTNDPDSDNFQLAMATAPYQTIGAVSDATYGNVWQHLPGQLTTPATAYVGSYEYDYVPVKAGDVINVSARIKVSSAGVSASLLLNWLTAATNPPTSSSTFTSTATTSTSWVQVQYTATAAVDGAVRMGISTTTTSPGSAYYTELKMSRRSNSGAAGYSDYVTGDSSGMYPQFFGYVDQWNVTTDGFTSEATAKCVDWLGVASRPVDTYYRGKFLAALKAWSYTGAEAAWYWPTVQAESDTEATCSYASNGLTTYTLKLTKSAVAPEVGGFTSDATFPDTDGDSGTGGFTISDSNAAKGAVLSFVNKSFPVLPKLANEVAWGSLFWFKGTAPTSGRSCLWHWASANYQTRAGLYWESSGRFTAEVLGDAGINSYSPTDIYPSGEPMLIATRVSYDTATQIYSLNIYTWPVHATTYPSISGSWGIGAVVAGGPPAAAYIQWGGRIMGTVSQDFARGTFNHVAFTINATGAGTLSQSLRDSSYYAATGGTVAGGQLSEKALISDLLTFTSAPSYRRLDDNLSVILSPGWNQGDDANGLLTATAEDANGVFFAATDGAPTYHNRRRRVANVSRWTISEWSGQLDFNLDSSNVINQVVASREDGVSRTIKDDASIAEVGLRDKQIRRNVADTAELLNAAGWILHRYRGTNPRCDSLEVDATALNGTNDATLLAVAHGANISDRITLSNLPASAPADSLSFYVEGVNVTIRVDGSRLNYSVSLSVSDANRSCAFILEDDTYGILDGDASVLIY